MADFFEHVGETFGLANPLLASHGGPSMDFVDC